MAFEEEFPTLKPFIRYTKNGNDIVAKTELWCKSPDIEKHCRDNEKIRKAIEHARLENSNVDRAIEMLCEELRL